MRVYLPFDVIHDTIGKGIAIECIRKNGSLYLRVDFGGKFLDFIYPQQFCYHLRACEPKIQRIIMQHIVDSKRRGLQKGPFRLKYHFSMGHRATKVYEGCARFFCWDLSKQRNSKSIKRCTPRQLPRNFTAFGCLFTIVCWKNTPKNTAVLLT